MKIITQKHELLPPTRNVKITDTPFYKEFVECKKAHQIILNEMVRVACQIDHYENREFRNAKGNPNFNAMNRLVSKFRTKQEGLDNLPEFLFFKNRSSSFSLFISTARAGVAEIPMLFRYFRASTAVRRCESSRIFSSFSFGNNRSGFD